MTPANPPPPSAATNEVGSTPTSPPGEGLGVPDTVIPITTASGTDVTTSTLTALSSTATAPSPSHPTISTTSTSAPTSSLAHAAPPQPQQAVQHGSSAGSYNATLMLDGPGLADDGSVLPVPSHVVLHHLSTSAIRNGVLAVGTTTRYKKKYLTTIYYKPISS
ncbi:hypothetical protein JAAARDRAFT_121533 [Jaapia argillacea MUCL 33604]|uniref:Association with the SNF1 complex (ASC) domain-containing protein n=1 Tax=Jaapia argillacea MUCL 33604 TaxID=933084 RepID=A0A067QGS5_9AGAM|nr:hypothetical protein JAAARDRAFT_121533 [Jaapia argillacea MUCL 33604]